MIIAGLAFYFFLGHPAAVRDHGDLVAQPGAFGAVPDPRFFNAAGLFVLLGARVSWR